MTKSQHTSTGDFAQNQNNAMSDDPGDGSRNSFTADEGARTPVEKAPTGDAQDQSTIEAFGEEGAGIAPKE